MTFLISHLLFWTNTHLVGIISAILLIFFIVFIVIFPLIIIFQLFFLLFAESILIGLKISPYLRYNWEWVSDLLFQQFVLIFQLIILKSHFWERLLRSVIKSFIFVSGFCLLFESSQQNDQFLPLFGRQVVQNRVFFSRHLNYRVGNQPKNRYLSPFYIIHITSCSCLLFLYLIL